VGWSSPVFVLVSKFKTPFQDFMPIIFHQGAIVRVIHTKARPQGLGSQMSCLRQWVGDFSMFINFGGEPNTINQPHSIIIFMGGMFTQSWELFMVLSWRFP
jgi:hypothetical protein